MKNKEQFKKTITLVAALILIAIFAFSFSYVWHNYYNEVMKDPFWRNGNILLVGIYTVLYIVLTNSFTGFRVGYYTNMGLFGSQVLGILGTNVISYIQISLIGRGRLSPAPMLILTAGEVLCAALWVIAFSGLFSKLYPPRRMIIVYGNDNARDLVRKMSNRTDKYLICESINYKEGIGAIKDRMMDYEAVIISDIPHELRSQIMKFALDNSIRTYINPKLSDIIIRGADDFHLFDTPLLLNRNEGLRIEQRVCKRIMDLTFSVLGLLVVSPFMLITALIIKLYDRGPVFYKQERMTTNGKVFNVYKFRSMIVNAEKTSGATLAKEKDSRITPVGKIIRKIRFDEMPQLINILKGDMSFVGPRPERPELANKYEETMPEFRYRLKVKAGLTGYAQIMGKYNTTPYDKLKMDLMYIEKQSIRLDFKIMLMTLKICFVPSATEGVKDDKNSKKKVKNK